LHPIGVYVDRVRHRIVSHMRRYIVITWVHLVW